VAQVFFFALFLFFVFVTDLRYLKGYPVSLFLELDPLVAFATAITTHTVYMGLLWCLALIIPTLLFGRVFCNWICPYGILHHFTGWLLGKRRAEERERIEANRYQKLYSLKYVILIAMIAAAVGGTLQIGWLDPICLFHRSMSTVILPMLNLFFPSSIYVRQ
jgi:polyferredoxin